MDMDLYLHHVGVFAQQFVYFVLFVFFRIVTVFVVLDALLHSLFLGEGELLQGVFDGFGGVDSCGWLLSDTFYLEF